MAEQHCHSCGNPLNSWDLRCSKALAYRFPICEKCMALEYDKTPDELRAYMEDWFGMRPCMGHKAVVGRTEILL